MINNIPMPVISDKFTIEDIHKIREWNYERFKNADFKEYTDEINREAAKVQNDIDKLRKKAINS
jgi:hypothetical protein